MARSTLIRTLAFLAGLAAACAPGAVRPQFGSVASVTPGREANPRPASPGPSGTPGETPPATPSATPTGTPGASPTPDPLAPGRGFPAGAPWVSFYGNAAALGDLDRVAATFRIVNLEADPDVAAFTPDQIARLQAGGANRVISYFNLGSCESWRTYWSEAPAGFVPCGANTAAQRGAYEGYPDETWMDLGNADYQELLLDHVAPRLAARGVDGFFFDNFELVEHGTATTNGPCDAACSQGGLDLVRRLREKYPDLLFVMQNATSDRTRLGTTGGLAFPSLLDGISHESVFTPELDAEARDQLVAWRDMDLKPGGRPFWIGTEDYVGSCDNASAAIPVYAASRELGLSPYATDASAGQQAAICFWEF